MKVSHGGALKEVFPCVNQSNVFFKTSDPGRSLCDSASLVLACSSAVMVGDFWHFLLVEPALWI